MICIRIISLSYFMTWTEANTLAYKLWDKWVSSRPAVGINGYLRESREQSDYRKYDLDYIHECILREFRAARDGKIRVSPGLLREMRWELSQLGKARKALLS